VFDPRVGTTTRYGIEPTHSIACDDGSHQEQFSHWRNYRYIVTQLGGYASCDLFEVEGRSQRDLLSMMGGKGQLLGAFGVCNDPFPYVGMQVEKSVPQLSASCAVDFGPLPI
jgi:hypothetical protein